MDDELLGPFARLLTDLSPPATVRGAEKDGSAPELWAAIGDSGFLDALVPEDSGGVGLLPQNIASLVIACGEHLVPVPVAETIVARALLARHGADVPADAPILLWPLSEDGMLSSPVAPVFSDGCLALVQSGNGMTLVEAAQGERDGFGLPAALISADAPPLAAFESDIDLLTWAAAITSAHMAGAMNRVLAMSIAHASERNQFGRPLSKFQAIQHHLAVMAERVAASNAAAHFVFASERLALNPWRAAAAKCMVNQAAPDCCGLAHAVHGAIGISEEHDLQLHTRRIKRWQLSFGSEAYWARRVAASWREQGGGTSIDRIRRQIRGGSADG